MQFFKTRDVKSPERKPGDVGYDFFIPDDWCPKDTKELLQSDTNWHVDGSYQLRAGKDVLIPSGLHIRMPEGYALIGFNKSGRATEDKLIVGACVIDESYQGEVHLHLINTGFDTVRLYPGEKALQYILVYSLYLEPNEVTSLKILYSDHKSDRGTGGFGSTGLK